MLPVIPRRNKRGLCLTLRAARVLRGAPLRKGVFRNRHRYVSRNAVGCTAKAAVKNADILFLCQDMTQLNLYGTIICTVCTLDSLNHLKSLDEIKKVFSSFRFLRRRAEFSFLTSTPFTSTKKFSVTMRLSMKTATLFARGKTALTATR